MPEEERRISPAVAIIPVGLGLAALAAIAALAWAAPPTVYTCPYCGATFATEEELLAHIEAEHPEVPPVFTCPYCGATFATQAELLAHIEAEHPEVPPVFTCPYCGATFATQEELDAHIATIHLVVYQCGNCGQYFSSREELDAHLTIHLEELPPGTVITTEKEFYLGEQKIIKVTVTTVPSGMLPPGSVTRPDGTLTTQWYDPTQIDWRTRTCSKGWYGWYGFTELNKDMGIADTRVVDTWAANVGKPIETELRIAVLGMYIKNTELWLEDAYNREPYIVLASPTEADFQERIRLQEIGLVNLKEALADLESRFVCLYCGAWFTTQAELDAHIAYAHPPSHYWFLPTGHNDPADEWDDEPLAYDGLIDTRARVTIGPQRWSPYLELSITPTVVSAIRWWASHQTSTLQPTRKFPTQVDVYYNGTWYNVYDGNKAVMWDSGLDIPEGSQIISRARIRLYNESTTLNKKLGLNEFQFYGYAQ